MKEYQIEEIKKTLIEVLRKHGVKKKSCPFWLRKRLLYREQPVANKCAKGR